ncbi:hypothetical protein Sango_2190100 [Sesamum angolense]|uniref:Uncharacterized protein n=1 Tax=Sesamum angolense TaxID=2727404 RepID=A0AAE1WDB7_9LAMI|nr:hypothetical protein Sango_2190100 [Sesamum angolense]
MAERSKAEIPGKYDLNEKWDACLDLGVRRFVYSSFAGAFAGLLLFQGAAVDDTSDDIVGSGKSCNTLGICSFWCWVGIGSAYSECSHKFNGSPPKLTPYISGAPPSKKLCVLFQDMIIRLGRNEAFPGQFFPELGLPFPSDCFASLVNVSPGRFDLLIKNCGVLHSS